MWAPKGEKHVYHGKGTKITLPDGKTTPVDGEYILDDGTKLLLSNGVIKEYRTALSEAGYFVVVVIILIIAVLVWVAIKDLG